MEKLHDRLYRLHDDAGVTSYLVIGERKAYMIDCGMGTKPVMPEIRAVTGLPVELLLTHAHPDHIGHADEFETIWLCEAERPFLPDNDALCAAFGVAPLEAKKIRFFEDGEIFDAGALTIEALCLPGHTPGSCAFGVPAWKALFTGDAVGSGEIVLMAIVGALPLDAFKQSLMRFEERAAAYEGGSWHGGHVHQAGEPGTPGYNPPSMQMVRDMAVLCGKILSGEIAGEEVPERNSPQGWALRAAYGRAGIIYLPQEE